MNSEYEIDLTCDITHLKSFGDDLSVDIGIVSALFIILFVR